MRWCVRKRLVEGGFLPPRRGPCHDHGPYAHRRQGARRRGDNVSGSIAIPGMIPCPMGRSWCPFRAKTGSRRPTRRTEQELASWLCSVRYRQIRLSKPPGRPRSGCTATLPIGTMPCTHRVYKQAFGVCRVLRDALCRLEWERLVPRGSELNPLQLFPVCSLAAADPNPKIPIVPCPDQLWRLCA